MCAATSEYTVSLESLIDIAREAGAAIMKVYASEFEARMKEDASPVTIADEEAELIITAALKKLTPDIPVVAEEAISAGNSAVISEVFWLVDPLDGTKEFISRNGEFTVNIALIERGYPVAGVVYAPALERLFAGSRIEGEFVQGPGKMSRITVGEAPSRGITVVASRSHGDANALAEFLGNRKVAEFRNAGSSLKICLVATGEADLYPRLGRTMEWDIAAGDAILRAAGGQLRKIDGDEMRYGKPNFENPHFVAFGKLDNN